MEADSARPLDDLLGHRGWVLALARSLLADPEAAEDVAQETWLAALRRPPEPDRPPRPWLARVVRNLAFERLRGDAARAGRERDAARERGAGGGSGGGGETGPELPATDELLARLETQRALAELLESLEEPYRTALLLRHVEGLSSAEIARRQGVPSATVRSRVQRGLELLRARLDARYGSRRAWGLALGGLLGRVPVPPPAGSPPASADPLATPVAFPVAGGELGAGSGAAALSGVLVMSLVWKLAAAAALVVTAVLFATRLGSSPAPASAALEARAPALAPVAALPGAPEGPELAPAASGEPARSAAVAPAAARPLDAAADERPAPREARVEGRVVDELGRPLAGASVRGRNEDADLELTTRGDGSFELVRPLGERARQMVSLAVSFPGRATRFPEAQLRADDTTHLGNVELSPGAWVEGRVLGPRGAAVPGARVLVTGPDLPWSPMAARATGPQLRAPVPEVRCGAGGSFRLEGLPEGPARVWAVAEGMRWAHGEPLELVAGSGASGLELELERRVDQDRIAGRVLDPEGLGVATYIHYSFQVPSMGKSGAIQSDDEGRFELWLEARAPHDLRARATDEAWADGLAREVEPGTLDLVLQLRESELLPLRVTGPAGPVGEYSVTVIEAGGGQLLSSLRRQEHADGSCTVRVPSVSFQVQVTATGHTLGLSEALDPAALPAALDLRLDAAPVVAGRVVDERGEPVGGARVELRRVYADHERAFTNGFRVLYEHGFESDQSDERGAFALTLRRPGRHVVVADKQGRPAVVSEVLDLGPGGAQGLELAWVPGGAIEGRVRVDPGVDPSGTVVVVNRGDGKARSRRAGPDGSFRFEDLGVGPWQVLATDAEIDHQSKTSTFGGGGGGGEPVPIEWHCRVESDATTWHDLDLRTAEACRLRGRFMLDSRPAERAWVVRLEHGQARDEAFELPSGLLDREGRFELQVGAPGEYQLVLIRTEDQRVTRLTHDLRLQAGDNAWELELETASLEVENAPVDADSELNLRFVWSDPERGVVWETLCAGDATGRLELPQVPAGHARLQTFAAPDEHGWRGFDDRLTVELEPGQRGQAVLP